MLTDLAKHRKQGVLLLEAAKERRIHPRRLGLDLVRGSTQLDRRELPLIFPISYAARTSRGFLNTSRSLRAVFRGFKSARRQKELGRLRLPKVSITFSNKGRETKAFDAAYYAELSKSQLALCPRGDYVWSYRFYEAILCGAIPVITDEWPDTAGYNFYRIVDADWAAITKLPYRRDWAETNYARLLSRNFFSPTLAKQSSRTVIASILRGSKRGNVGDALGPYLYARVVGDKPAVCYARETSRESGLTLVGSILQDFRQTKPRIVWGAGLIAPGSAKHLRRDKVLGVRGPLTAACVIRDTRQLPRIVSDPGLAIGELLPREIEADRDLGFVIHSVDRDYFKARKQELPAELIDNYCGNVEELIRSLQRYRRVISSSLHGCVLAHAYGIPALPVRISGRVTGGSWKFRDYYASVGCQNFVMPMVQSRQGLEKLRESRDFWSPPLSLVSELARNWLAGLKTLCGVAE